MTQTAIKVDFTSKDIADRATNVFEMLKNEGMEDKHMVSVAAYFIDLVTQTMSAENDECSSGSANLR